MYCIFNLPYLKITWIPQSEKPYGGYKRKSYPITDLVVAQRGVEEYLYSSKTSALEGGEWSAARPGRNLPPGERPGTHCTGGWMGPRAGLEGQKISPPPGFDPWTVQPIVS